MTVYQGEFKTRNIKATGDEKGLLEGWAPEPQCQHNDKKDPRHALQCHHPGGNPSHTWPASGAVWVPFGGPTAKKDPVSSSWRWALVYVHTDGLLGEDRKLDDQRQRPVFMPWDNVPFLGFLQPGETRVTLRKMMIAQMLASYPDRSALKCASKYHSDQGFGARDPKSWDGLWDIYTFSMWGICPMCMEYEAASIVPQKGSYTQLLNLKMPTGTQSMYRRNAMSSDAEGGIILYNGNRFVQMRETIALKYPRIPSNAQVPTK